MDIAIVSPSPKPFAMGGIEKLMLGLYKNIDELTDHRVELIKLPTQENDFWNLIDSYEMFYNLDLRHFDMIISCKYPAWMVQHKKHVIYMAHHLRGLFDTYHFLNMPEKMHKTSVSSINTMLNYVRDKNNLSQDLTRFFNLYNHLKASRNELPPEPFSFPGSFIREIIHFLDNWALHPSRITRYLSISKTVTKRSDYFPENSNVEVLYPPTSLVGLSEGLYKYFLVVGRLDGPKRVDLIVQAMKEIDDPNCRLIIAGSGPEEARIKGIALGDKRTTFIGYIDNKKLVELYSDALAVIYVPYDEDYGLVTIEAMKCGKPVITCVDSGGTTEFVEHNITGLIAENNSKSLALQMNALLKNRDFAEELGQNAKGKIQYINWENCVQGLVGNSKQKLSTSYIKKKKEMLVLSTYPVLPRKHGGQLRIFNIYKNLTNMYNVTIVSLTKDGNGYSRKVGDLLEICIQMSPKHIEKEWNIEKEVGIPVTDIVAHKLSYLTPEYHKMVENRASESEILVSSHPYLSHLLDQYIGEKHIIYDSHNVEYELKKSMLPDNKHAKLLLNNLFDLEKEACKRSDLIFACSDEDASKLCDLYGMTRDKILTVPNGVDLTLNSFVGYKEKQLIKKQLNIENEKIVVFIGSWHKPNLEAVEQILEISKDLPQVKFIIMGGQCLAFEKVKPPRNVVFAGIVDESMKKLIYSIADIAINPMINGSGTNLKVAEYIANGVPVISTEIGIRGYNLIPQEHVVISNLTSFSKEINMLLNDSDRRAILPIGAREYIEEEFSWGKIAEKVTAKLTKENY